MPKPKDKTVFLSSLCHELSDVRLQIHELFNQSEYLPNLFADEIDDPKAKIDVDDHFNIVGLITEMISRADAVIVLIGRISTILYDHGTIISTDSEVSFWEMELYHAAILNLPTFIIVEEGIKLSERKYLANIFKILPSITGDIYYEKQSNMANRAAEIIQNNLLKENFGVISYLSCLQSIRRSPYDPKLQIFDKDVSSYQFRKIKFVSDLPNYTLLKFCIEEASKEQQYQKRISKYYLAYRELLKVPYWRYQDTDVLLDWATVCSGLSEDLRWYGIHGHLKLGVLQYTADYGAVFSMLKKKGHDINGRQLHSPYALFAGEYFSLYKYLKGENLAKTLHNIELGLKNIFREADKINLLSIRGACYLSERDFKSAVIDFEEVFNWVATQTNDIEEIAHNKVKLGVSYFFSGDKTKGLQFAESGMALHENETANKVRSLRIMMLIYEHSGNGEKARKAKQEALAIARNIGALDQVRKINLNIF